MNKNKKILLILAGVFTLITVSYLAGFTFTEIEQRKALEEIEISFHSATLKDIGFSGVTVDLGLEMYNPNDITATLDRADYDIWFNDNFLGSGVTFERVDIESFTSKIVHTDFDLDYVGAGSSIISAITEGKAKWRLAGTAHYDTIFGTMDISFDITK